MKKLLTNWRLWLIVVQTCVALCMIMDEPTNEGNVWLFLFRLISVKAGGILLFTGIMAELSLWKKYFPFLANASEE